VDDGIEFDLASIRASQIRREADYGGVRVNVKATLQRARISVQVDIGFGDVVFPAPETISYPTLLEDMPAPTLRAYPMYTVVAEKYQAHCALGMVKQPNEGLLRFVGPPAQWRTG